MTIVPLYAALLGLLYIWLSFRVIKARRLAKIAIGDGGNPALQRAIAAHNNFAQYVPLTLLLLVLCDLRFAPSIMVHSLCIAFVLGRALHAYGISRTPENFRYRSTGMVLTFVVIAVASLYLIEQFVYRAFFMG